MHHDDMQRLTEMVARYGVSYLLSALAVICDAKAKDGLRVEHWQMKATLLRACASKVPS